MITNQYSYFLNQLKLSSARRKLAFDVKLTKRTRQLAVALRSLNLITRFYKLTSSTYRVFPSYTRFRRHTRTYQSFARPTGRTRLTLRSLRSLSYLTPHTHYIVETDCGVMTHKEALRLQRGGYLLVILQ